MAKKDNEIKIVLQTIEIVRQQGEHDDLHKTHKLSLELDIKLNDSYEWMQIKTDNKNEFEHAMYIAFKGLLTKHRKALNNDLNRFLPSYRIVEPLQPITDEPESLNSIIQN